MALDVTWFVWFLSQNIPSEKYILQQTKSGQTESASESDSGTIQSENEQTQMESEQESSPETAQTTKTVPLTTKRDVSLRSRDVLSQYTSSQKEQPQRNSENKSNNLIPNVETYLKVCD